MQVRPGGLAGGSHQSNRLSCFHIVSLAHEVALIVRVESNPTAGMLDQDHVAHGRQVLTVAVEDAAAVGGAYVRSALVGDVNAHVEALAKQRGAELVNVVLLRVYEKPFITADYPEPDSEDNAQHTPP